MINSTLFKIDISLVYLNMKKLQNYLMKPEQLRKKLENPKFRQDFVEWNRSHISLNREHSKHSRSKSPVQHIQRSLQVNLKRPLSSNKENLKLQSNSKPITINKPNTRVALTSKTFNNERNSKTQLPIKRNISNSFIKPIVDNSCRQINDSLSHKSRYNSCSSIDNQKRQRISSHLPVEQTKRIIKQRYSYRTKQGVQATNPNKVNQDSLVIKTNLAQKNVNLYAVADGHGTFGHMVSQYLVKNISKFYESQSKSSSINESIPKVFERLQRGLTQSEMNVSCSGSTLVNVLIEGDEVICANVGDSRAILARQIDRKSWELIYLSQDHKPSVQSEKKRIIKNGGRVHAFKDENGCALGPLRVWLPNQNLQGLAMSRSFGDNVSKSVGVSSEPEIIRMKLDKRDKFILLASDGVWQFITNQEVLQLVVPYYKQGRLEEACDALSKLAYERWTSQDTTVVDDTTFILIFLSQ